MKKIKTLILSIYSIFILLSIILTIFFVFQTFSKGIKLYFREQNLFPTEYLIDEKEIDKIINDLKIYHLI